MFYNISMGGVAMKLLADTNCVSVRGSNWLNALHLPSLTAPYCLSLVCLFDRDLICSCIAKRADLELLTVFQQN